jgi:hypothetical protein
MWDLLLLLILPEEDVELSDAERNNLPDKRNGNTDNLDFRPANIFTVTFLLQKKEILP